MAAAALQEEFFSAANLSWFAVGIFAEIVFLGLGATPGGMELGANIAQSLGMLDPISATQGVSEVITSAGEAALAF